MKKEARSKVFRVEVTEQYIYDEVRADSKEEAIRKVIRSEAWDNCDNPFEITAHEIEDPNDEIE